MREVEEHAAASHFHFLQNVTKNNHTISSIQQHITAPTFQVLELRCLLPLYLTTRYTEVISKPNYVGHVE